MHIVPSAPTRWLVLFLLLIPASVKSLPAQSHDPDYDDVDPWAGVKPLEQGPDSSSVARFFTSLAAADPVVCQFVAHSIGNNWRDWEIEYRVGTLKAEVAAERARESLSRRVTDHSAISHLTAALGSPQPCVRRTAARMLGQSGAPEAARQMREALR